MERNASMDVDLVIAYYNGGEYIESAILSAINQTISFSKIFIVDDGSDSTNAIIAEDIAAKYGVVYLAKPNGGQGSARNYGVNQSCAGLICFLDQDDFLLPDHNEVLMAEFSMLSGSKGWVSSNFSCSDQYGAVYHKKANPAIGHQLNNIYQLVDHDLFMLPSGTIISSKAFRAVGGFDEQFKGYEDDDLFIRLFRAGYSFKYIDQDTYVWRMHGGQTSSSIKMLHSRKKFIDKWMGKDYGASVDEFRIKSSIIRRFRSVLVRDILFAKDDQFVYVAQGIVAGLVDSHGKFIPFKLRIAFLFLVNAPLSVSRSLYFIYKIVRGGYR